MKRLSIAEPHEAPKLIEEIATAANGVFLWVKLVVSSLLKGLGNHDQVSDLQARLRILPKKLEELYVHMVLRVDESYQKEASRLYELVAAATNSRSDDWKVVTPLSIFALSLAEEKNPNLVLTAPRRF
jgi:23S rRNA C2498 (ribose-2'-O)-methylase RlmM